VAPAGEGQCSARPGRSGAILGAACKDVSLSQALHGLLCHHLTTALPPPLPRRAAPPPDSCVDYVRLTTNKGSTIEIGNPAGSAPSFAAVPNRAEGFLAAVRGYENFNMNQPITKGSLEQLQFVWGVSVCPEAQPAAPDAPAPAEPAAPEAPVPAPEEVPAPEPAAPQEPLCPAQLDKCNPAPSASGPATCAAVAPFTAPHCVGGCCVSSGKCKRGFCSQAGLGSEVMDPGLLCWGTNSGHINRFNKCRNLACKLAVPGCITDPLSGSCIGSVVALSNDVDDEGKKWVGSPCLQPVPSGLPVDALGKVDASGAYAGKL
jgi:hypothetical protein